MEPEDCERCERLLGELRIENEHLKETSKALTRNDGTAKDWESILAASRECERALA
jgi:hypothetical protein